MASEGSSSELQRSLATLRARYELRGCASVGRAPRASGRVWIHGDGMVHVGNDVFLDAENAPIELYSWPGAEIVIGDDVHIEGGTSIEATESVVVGARSRLGPFCRVMDSHFHPLVGDRNVRPASHPVVIEADVALGSRSIVLAGAHVERGASVEAGTVVRRPPGATHSSLHDAPPIVPSPRIERDVTPSYLVEEMLRLARLLATDRRAAIHRLDRALGVMRARILFRKCEYGALVNAQGHVRVLADGRLRLGDRVQLSGGMFPTELLCRAGAELSIGARTLLSYGVSVDASRCVRIGERCMFGSMVRIRDTNEQGGAPVHIGDDVWVAHGATIEPGATIGDASVVGAGSVVRDDVPPGALAFGNPAVCVPIR